MEVRKSPEESPKAAERKKLEKADKKSSQNGLYHRAAEQGTKFLN